jgi:hypothetical protein
MTDTANQPMAPAPPAAPNAMDSMVAAYGQNALIVALGALIVLATDLVFVVFGDYSFSSVTWAASAVALVAVLLRRYLPAVLAENYAAVVFVAAGVAVLMSIRDFVVDIVFIPGRSLDVTFFLGMVGLYVGVIVMAFGAWRMMRG